MLKLNKVLMRNYIPFSEGLSKRGPVYGPISEQSYGIRHLKSAPFFWKNKPVNRTYLCINADTDIHIDIYTCVLTYIHTCDITPYSPYIHVCIHIYMYMFMYRCIMMFICSCYAALKAGGALGNPPCA